MIQFRVYGTCWFVSNRLINKYGFVVTGFGMMFEQQNACIPNNKLGTCFSYPHKLQHKPKHFDRRCERFDSCRFCVLLLLTVCCGLMCIILQLYFDFLLIVMITDYMIRLSKCIVCIKMCMIMQQCTCACALQFNNSLEFRSDWMRYIGDKRIPHSILYWYSTRTVLYLINKSSTNSEFSHSSWCMMEVMRRARFLPPIVKHRANSMEKKEAININDWRQQKTIIHTFQ